jgi:hypothetical protein
MKWMLKRSDEENMTEEEDENKIDGGCLKKGKLIVKNIEVSEGSENECEDYEEEESDDENEIETTSEFHYQTGEKCPTELQRMEDERVRQIMKKENDVLSNTSLI